MRGALTPFHALSTMAGMTLATAKPKRTRPAKRCTPADGRERRILDHGAWFLVCPR